MIDPTLRRPPSMQSLICFEVAERLGTLTRAAAELHMTQGAVSRQLLALEARVGTRLFAREHHRLLLTPAGRTFLAEVRPLLQRLERAVSDLRSHQGLGGRLRLSVASTFATHWLIPRLPSFTEAHPEITLDLATRIGPVDFARVDVDAAITYVEAVVPPARGVALVPLQLRPFARPSLPKGRGWPWLDTAPLLVNTSVPEGWASWAAEAGVAPVRRERLRQRGGARYDLLSMALNAAMAGIGVALLPDFLVSPALAEKRLMALSSISWRSPRAYHLSYPPEQAELPALLRFREWIVAQAAG
jgi:LysR family transcriptional regulator, glycine cleavage system transcriptional activator